MSTKQTLTTFDANLKVGSRHKVRASSGARELVNFGCLGVPFGLLFGRLITRKKSDIDVVSANTPSPTVLLKDVVIGELAELV